MIRPPQPQTKMKKWNHVCKTVRNMPPTLLTHSQQSSLLILTAAIISYTKTEPSRLPCNIIAGNDGAITAIAVTATYSINSNNDSNGKSCIASMGAQALLVQQSMQSYTSKLIQPHWASLSRRIVWLLFVLVHFITQQVEKKKPFHSVLILYMVYSEKLA